VEARDRLGNGALPGMMPPLKDDAMAEITTLETQTDAKAGSFEAKIEVPKLEVPAAFREFAEKGASQAKESYAKLKSAAEDATDVWEATYVKASKGYAEYGLKVIAVARSNTTAALDFASELMNVKSLSEAIELSTAHTRKQLEALSAQAKELAALGQKVATETSEPIKSGLDKAFSKAA
jgi:phasin